MSMAASLTKPISHLGEGVIGSYLMVLLQDWGIVLGNSTENRQILSLEHALAISPLALENCLRRLEIVRL